jgi:4-aminobutyrate aminotransferase-like enzyme
MASKGAAVASESVIGQAYQEYVNPQWVALLNLLDMNVECERCLGCELFPRDGRRILDFLSGYCVHNTGHNHPYIVEALKEELDKCGPAMLQSHVPALAGELAERLCQLAGGGLKKAYFGTQICGNNFMVLKAAPPLVVTDGQLDEFVEAIRSVVELADTSSGFWTEALHLARRAVNI